MYFIFVKECMSYVDTKHIYTQNPYTMYKITLHQVTKTYN